MLYHDLANLGIGQLLEQFGTGVIHARGNLLYNLGHLRAPTCCIRLESLNLPIKICFLSLSGDTCIQSYSFWGGCFREKVSDDDGTRVELISIKPPCFPLTKSRFVADVHLFRVLAQSHKEKVS